MERLKIIGKELLNILTNLIVPLLGPIILICEILPLPIVVPTVLKKVEYYLFNFCGTLEDLENKE